MIQRFDFMQKQDPNKLCKKSENPKTSGMPLKNRGSTMFSEGTISLT